MGKEFRQIVSDMSITSSKEYNDFLYGWLVLNAHVEGEVYIWKRDFVLSKMEQELGMTRKTLSKYLSFLVKEGLVVEEEDRYVLPNLKDKGFWVDEDIIYKLIECRLRYVVSIYIYLRKSYWASGEKSLIVSMDHLKEFIGLSTNTRSNNKIITNIFESFRVAGLLKYELRHDITTKKSYYTISGLEKTNYF